MQTVLLPTSGCRLNVHNARCVLITLPQKQDTYGNYVTYQINTKT